MVRARLADRPDPLVLGGLDRRAGPAAPRWSRHVRAALARAPRRRPAPRPPSSSWPAPRRRWPRCTSRRAGCSAPSRRWPRGSGRCAATRSWSTRGPRGARRAASEFGLFAAASAQLRTPGRVPRRRHQRLRRRRPIVPGTAPGQLPELPGEQHLDALSSLAVVEGLPTTIFINRPARSCTCTPANTTRRERWTPTSTATRWEAESVLTPAGAARVARVLVTASRCPCRAWSWCIRAQTGPACGVLRCSACMRCTGAHRGPNGWVLRWNACAAPRPRARPTRTPRRRGRRSGRSASPARGRHRDERRQRRNRPAKLVPSRLSLSSQVRR